jgi:hypothetical protein
MGVAPLVGEEGGATGVEPMNWDAVVGLLCMVGSALAVALLILLIVSYA